ncbi:unnamed protein product [Discula destructiva]
MHTRYGPIVRISPNELHCSDPGFINEIYPGGSRKRNKPLHQVDSVLGPLSEFGTVDHDLHRARRIPSARFFSRSMVSRLEDQIASLTQQVCDKILATKGSHEPFDVNAAFSNLTVDVVSQACFGESFGLLDQPGFDLNFSQPTRAGLQHQYMWRYFPVTRKLNKLMVWFVDYLPSNTALMVRTMQIDLPKTVQNAIDSQNTGIVSECSTIVQATLASSLDRGEKSLENLLDRILTVLGAGAETTSWAIAVIVFHLSSQPAMLSRLTNELEELVKDPHHLPSWAALEKLPYLDGVIQEGLRLSYGVSARTARIPTQEDLIYQGVWQKRSIQYTIPRGYAIGMSNVITSHDETLFPDSHKFQPERWMDLEHRRSLDHAHLTFGRGSRGCLGMSLAMCELHYVVSAVTLRVLPHLRLYETTEDDVRYDHDMLVPMARYGSKGVRAIVEYTGQQLSLCNREAGGIRHLQGGGRDVGRSSV